MPTFIVHRRTPTTTATATTATSANAETQDGTRAQLVVDESASEQNFLPVLAAIVAVVYVEKHGQEGSRPCLRMRILCFWCFVAISQCHL